MIYEHARVYDTDSESRKDEYYSSEPIKEEKLKSGQRKWIKKMRRER